MTGIDIKPDAQGKVRDLYDLGDKLLLVATDRISAFDYILEDEIPHKGAVLTQLSCFWFELLDGVVENHLISSDVADLPEQFQPYADYLRGRVLYTQEKTFRQLLKAQEESVRAHEAVRLAFAEGRRYVGMTLLHLVQRSDPGNLPKLLENREDEHDV